MVVVILTAMNSHRGFALIVVVVSIAVARTILIVAILLLPTAPFMDALNPVQTVVFEFLNIDRHHIAIDILNPMLLSPNVAVVVRHLGRAVLAAAHPPARTKKVNDGAALPTGVVAA